MHNKWAAEDTRQQEVGKQRSGSRLEEECIDWEGKARRKRRGRSRPRQFRFQDAKACRWNTQEEHESDRE